MNKYEKSLFIFRRDLRLFDNTALIEALKTSKEVIPTFIIDPRILDRITNTNILQFLVESLMALNIQLEKQRGRLIIFHDTPEVIVSSLIKRNTIDAIYVNQDYTAFSQKRDTKIARLCKEKNLDFHQFADYLLNEPEEVYSTKFEPYTVFTPYYRKASQISVRYPEQNKYTNYSIEELDDEVKIEKLPSYIEKENHEIAVRGGIDNCIKILRSLTEYKNYEYERDFPALNKTTHLSAYLKFGICSIREVYHGIRTQLGNNHPLLRQLYWRDFFTQIGYYFPKVYTEAFRDKYNKLEWEQNDKSFKAWCEGKTGFPIVDAGMRELNTTGYMHNRVRMIVASFLTKDLHIDWRKGEKYFVEKLVDFDISVNNGNWQWAASTGCDAQPYFRIFNPWSQQKKYDPECEYIKKWIPELRELEAKSIHKWYEINADRISYPKPIVNHSIESQKAKKMYKKIDS